jgi:hypothetical protein
MTLRSHLAGHLHQDAWLSSSAIPLQPAPLASIASRRNPRHAEGVKTRFDRVSAAAATVQVEVEKEKVYFKP